MSQRSTKSLSAKGRGFCRQLVLDCGRGPTSTSRTRYQAREPLKARLEVPARPAADAAAGSWGRPPSSAAACRSARDRLARPASPAALVRPLRADGHRAAAGALISNGCDHISFHPVRSHCLHSCGCPRQRDAQRSTDALAKRWDALSTIPNMSSPTAAKNRIRPAMAIHGVHSLSPACSSW
jgi:hypothetical protein